MSLPFFFLVLCSQESLQSKEKVARYRQRVALHMDVKPDAEGDRLDDDPNIFKLKAAAGAIDALNSEAAPDPTQLSGAQPKI